MRLYQIHYMPGETSRQNGKKGGRPKGSVSQETELRLEIKKQLVELAHEKTPELFDAQLDLALGHYREDPELGRVYLQPPDPKAIQWLLNQVIGKAMNQSQIDVTSNGQGGVFNLAELLERARVEGDFDDISDEELGIIN